MFIDIACNVTTKELEVEIPSIISECRKQRVLPVFVGLDIPSSKRCLELARAYDTCCYLGIHPNHIDHTPDRVECLGELEYRDERVIGIGECGLDYFRSDKSARQLEIFALQVGLQDTYDLPMFYHCRAAFDDFIRVAAAERAHRGVIHSFDGTMAEMEAAVSKGLYIGINGCSLKTEENIRVVGNIPLSHLLLETDSPYCQVRRSHASSRFTEVDKGRFNTPVGIRKIAEVVAKVKQIPLGELEEIAYENTLRLFPKLKVIAERWMGGIDSCYGL